jgi:hypothetical protein
VYINRLTHSLVLAPRSFQDLLLGQAAGQVEEMALQAAAPAEAALVQDVFGLRLVLFNAGQIQIRGLFEILVDKEARAVCLQAVTEAAAAGAAVAVAVMFLCFATIF